MTTALNARFCKDIGIPISLFQEPYFTERLNLYDPFYHCLKKYEQFKHETEGLNAQEWAERYQTLKDRIITDIKTDENYQAFQKEDTNRWEITHKGLPGKTYYTEKNAGKNLISLDMQKANFSSLQYYHSAIFKYSKTWEEFVSYYTDSKHLQNSRYIRQVILGACNPKRQVTYEKYLMDKVLNHILDVKIKNQTLTEDQIVYFGADEIVFDLSSYTKTEQQIIYETLTTLKRILTIPLTIKKFRLEKIKHTDGYLKYFDDNTVEFKCLDSLMLPLVIRAYNNEPITPNDKVFYHNHLLAHLIEVPDLQIKRL